MSVATTISVPHGSCVSDLYAGVLAGIQQREPTFERAVVTAFVYGLNRLP
jgi:hypothetical protein